MTTLKVAFIWHMHQPWYLWPGTQQAALPFVRLHGCASYYDMPWLLGDFEQTTVTFNLVPALTEQMDRCGRGESTDWALELCRRCPADLELADRRYLLTRFATGHPSSAAKTSARYAQLLRKRGIGRNAEAIESALSQFTDAELRDLQVWLNLAWCGYAMRSKSEVVRGLRAKDRGFTEEEKLALLDEMQDLPGRALGMYRSLAEADRAELTTSPYYHPILPLLCDMRDAQRRIGRRQMPDTLWHAPDEARTQLERARQHHKSTFGALPEGLWPSEGAVSDAALAQVEGAGFSWAASDEAILAHSLNADATGRPKPEALYRPYRVGSGNLSLVFRDRQLSDRIGFFYRDWCARDAVEDMMARLRSIAAAMPSAAEPPLVCIVLDGENPWGWYQDGGEGFLRLLYAALEAHPAMETTSVSDYLRQFPAQTRLASVFPGSWIEHSFATWIGGDQHRRAWQLLTGALSTARSAEASEALQRAREHLMIAEGSDWFWWYSDQHFTLDADLFDALFRANIAEVYRALGESEPEPVHEPIAQTSRWRFDREAVGLMRPTVDGRVSSYFEWQAAALLRSSSLASAMHRSDFAIGELYIGFDLATLWLRVDTVGQAVSSLRGHELHFVLEGEGKARLILRWPDDEDVSEPELEGELSPAAQVAVNTIVEAGISMKALDVQPGGTLGVAVVLVHQARSVERWPEAGFLQFELPSEESIASTWLV